MLRAIKWAAVVATVAALATVFAPAAWPVSHSQALTNVIVGEFATLAMGYTAYRIAYGKDPSRAVAFGGAVCGAVIAASPFVFRFVETFATFNLVGGGVVAAVGLATVLATFVGDDRRRSHLRDVAGDAEATDEGAKVA